MIPHGVVQILSYAFYGNGNITDVIIPDTVKSIDSGAFGACNESIYSYDARDGVELKKVDGWVVGYRNLVTDELIVSGVRGVAEDAFTGSSLTSVVFSGDVQCIRGCRYCPKLSHVTISNGATEIDSSAFYECANLTSVTIPDSVTSIGQYAFCECSGLTSVTIPDSVTSIGQYAFCECSGLTNVVIGNGVANIGSSAFSDCSRLTSVTIPDSVTNIGHWAFEDCAGLTSVTIPDSVTSIGSFAFSGCTNLTSVTIPNGVTSIEGAFSGCSGLTSVTIGNGVTSIGYEAFKNCSGLTSVTIPDSVTSIGENAFYGCSGLTSVTIPDSVTSIGKNAFYGCSGLTSVTIGNGVTSIEYYTFYGCSGLTSVTIGNGVQYIDLPFEGCYGLTSIIFKGNAPSLWPRWAFASVAPGCTAYVSRDSTGWGVGIPGMWNSLEIAYIDNMPDEDPTVWTVTFDARGGVTAEASRSVTNDCSVGKLPVVTRNGYEFTGWFTADDGGAQVMESTVITNDITFYAHWTESGGGTGGGGGGAYGVPVFTIEDGVLVEVELNGATEVSIPSSVTSISDGVFADGWDLTSVTIPDGVTSIGAFAFARCIALTNVTMPGSVTSIGEGAVLSCYGLADVQGFVIVRHVLYDYMGNDSEVTIPDGVTSIGARVFSDRLDLTSVTIPDGVTSIGAGAFEWCIALTNVTMPGSVTSIGAGAFEACGLLSNVDIPESVTDIGADAFRGCSALTGLTIPDRVMSIGAGAFAGCSSLTDVVVPDSVTSIGEGAFSGNRLVEFVVDDANPSYKAVSGLLLTKDGRTLVVAPGCLTNVTIPEDVENIGAYAFGGYAYVDSLLRSVVIPNSVTNIGSGAFSSCSMLTNLTFNGNAPTVDGDYVFSVAPNCIVHVPLDSTGWGVDIPGTWNGVKIDYIDNMPNYQPEVWTVTFDACGGVTAEASRSVTNDCSVGELPMVTRNGYAFTGWFTADDGGVQATADMVVVSNMTLFARWQCNFSFGEGGVWTEQPDGGWKSGATADDSTNSISMAVSGSGTVSFRWKVSCEDYFVFRTQKILLDHLAFFVDGETLDLINGETDWTNATFTVEGTGEHALTWAYIKDSEGVAGADCAWLDTVTWTPSANAGLAVWLAGRNLAADARAANGRTAAECYALGLDPEDATNDFRIVSIEMVGGKPKVEWEPKTNRWTGAEIQAVLKGAATLEGPWADVPAGGNPAFRFFKVVVVP